MIATKVRKKEELGNLGNFTFVLNQVFARKYLGCVEEASESWADFPIYISLAPGWLCICSFWATATSGGSFNPLALREIEGIMSEWVYTPQISHVFIFFIFIMGKMIINHDFCGPDWHRLCLTVQEMYVEQNAQSWSVQGLDSSRALSDRFEAEGCPIGWESRGASGNFCVHGYPCLDHDAS